MSKVIEIYAIRLGHFVQCEECGFPLIGKHTRFVHDWIVKEHGEHPRPGAPATCPACMQGACEAILMDVQALNLQPPH